MIDMTPRTDFDSDIIIAFAKALAVTDGDGDLYSRIASDERTPEDVARFKSHLRKAKGMLAALTSGNDGLAVIPTTPPEEVRDAINQAVLQNIDMNGDWIGRLEWQSYLWKAAYIEMVRNAPFSVTPNGKAKGSAMPGERLAGVADTEMIVLPVDEVREIVDGEPGMKAHSTAIERIKAWIGTQETAWEK